MSARPSRIDENRRISIDPESALITIRITERVSAARITEAIEEIRAMPRFSPDTSRLWDLRGADLSALTSTELRAIRRHGDAVGLSEGSSRVALLVARDVDYGVARMYEMGVAGSQGPTISVFRDLAMAMEWLSESD